MSTHPQWTVIGASVATGEDVAVVVRAASRAEATDAARALGVLTREVAPAEQSEDSTAPPDNGHGAAERVVRVYATRPRDHLYIGWVLGHRATLTLTTHRVVLERRTLTGRGVRTIDIGAVEGVIADRAWRWWVVILALWLISSAVMRTRDIINAGTGTTTEFVVIGASVGAGLICVLLARVVRLGVVSASGAVAIVRRSLRAQTISTFVHETHKLVRDGVRADALWNDASTSDTCEVCGYPLAGLTSPTTCPECGSAVAS